MNTNYYPFVFLSLSHHLWFFIRLLMRIISWRYKIYSGKFQRLSIHPLRAMEELMPFVDEWMQSRTENLVQKQKRQEENLNNVWCRILSCRFWPVHRGIINIGVLWWKLRLLFFLNEKNQKTGCRSKSGVVLFLRSLCTRSSLSVVVALGL